MNNLENIGLIIKEYRTRAKVSQQQLELAINASFGSLSRIESGKVNPTKETLDKISKALKLSSEEKGRLFGIEGKLIKFDQSEDYIVEEAYSFYNIQYGIGKLSLLKRKMTIRSLRDELNNIYYYHTDPNTLLRYRTGLKSNKFKKLLQFDSWIGSSKDGPAGHTHRVSIPIKTINKDQKIDIFLDVRLNANYTELVNNTLTSHYFGSLILADTEKMEIGLNINQGLISRIVKLRFICEFKFVTLFEQKVKFNEGEITLNDNWGRVRVDRNNDKVEIKWIINKLIPKNFKLQITWYTAPK